MGTLLKNRFWRYWGLFWVFFRGRESKITCGNHFREVGQLQKCGQKKLQTLENILEFSAPLCDKNSLRYLILLSSFFLSPPRYTRNLIRKIFSSIKVWCPLQRSFHSLSQPTLDVLYLQTGDTRILVTPVRVWNPQRREPGAVIWSWLCLDKFLWYSVRWRRGSS